VWLSFSTAHPKKVRCEGCQALTDECWGNDCKIVQCLKSKGFNFCYECAQFDEDSCDKYNELAQRYLEDNVDVRANLNRIRSGEVEAWLKESRKRFTCPHCGKALPEGSKKCYHCGEEFAKIL